MKGFEYLNPIIISQEALLESVFNYQSLGGSCRYSIQLKNSPWNSLCSSATEIIWRRHDSLHRCKEFIPWKTCPGSWLGCLWDCWESKAEQQLCVLLSWSRGRLCRGSLNLSAQFHCTKSCKESEPRLWSSVGLYVKFELWCKNPIPIWDLKRFSFCWEIGLRFDSSIWLRDSSEMFCLIAWQAS